MPMMSSTMQAKLLASYVRIHLYQQFRVIGCEAFNTELHDDTYVYHNACERYAF